MTLLPNGQTEEEFRAAWQVRIDNDYCRCCDLPYADGSRIPSARWHPSLIAPDGTVYIVSMSLHDAFARRYLSDDTANSDTLTSLGWVHIRIVYGAIAVFAGRTITQPQEDALYDMLHDLRSRTVTRDTDTKVRDFRYAVRSHVPTFDMMEDAS